MTTNERDFIKALENDTSYDYIANHYTQMHESSLKDIILELLYAVHLAEQGRLESHEIIDSAIEELKDRWSEE